MKILFVGFKNRSSFLFTAPIIEYILLNSGGYKMQSFDILANFKYLSELINGKEFMDLYCQSTSHNINIYALSPFYLAYKEIHYVFSKNDLRSFFYALKNALNKSIMFFLFFIKFSIRVRKLQLKYKIFTPRQLFHNVYYNNVLIHGTNDTAAKCLISDLKDIIPSTSRVIWLPHAPHHGSINQKMPSVLVKYQAKVEIWLPSENENISDSTSNIKVFNSGYPPFSSTSLNKIRRTIDKIESNSTVLLLRQYKNQSDPTNYFLSKKEILTILRLIKDYQKLYESKKLYICPHPSINIKELETIIKSVDIQNIYIGSRYFLNYVGRNSLIIGSYSTVLLHAALLGLRTICLNDSIINYLRTNEPILYSLYVSYPLILVEPYLKDIVTALSKFRDTHFDDFLNDPRFLSSSLYRTAVFSAEASMRCASNLFEKPCY